MCCVLYSWMAVGTRWSCWPSPVNASVRPQSNQCQPRPERHRHRTTRGRPQRHPRRRRPEAAVRPHDVWNTMKVLRTTKMQWLVATPSTMTPVWLRLRSANRHQLIVPRCRLNIYGRRAFSIAGPTVWNSLPGELRDPACGSDSFKQFLKTILFSLY